MALNLQVFNRIPRQKVAINVIDTLVHVGQLTVLEIVIVTCVAQATNAYADTVTDNLIL
jgi:hypothetical protein